MNSMTVTSLPKAEKAEANSIPITPAPMMVRRLGSFGIESSSVEVTMFCSNCGNEVAEGAKFCSVCGARLSLDAEPSAHEHTAFSSSNREGNMMDKRESSTKFDFNFGSEDLEIKEPKKKKRK